MNSTPKALRNPTPTPPRNPSRSPTPNPTPNPTPTPTPNPTRAAITNLGAIAAGCLLALGGSVLAVDGVFGVLDNTADELADLLGVDEVHPAAARVVQLVRPVYEPIKAASPSCTDGIFPEFNDVNDFNDCLLLRSRVVWRPGPQLPLRLSQTMRMESLFKQSTGSSIWSGGLVLAREMEVLGDSFWAGKRVLELGTGTGLGAVTAAKLGASLVMATDRDADVLQLAAQNAKANLGARSAAFDTALLTWGSEEAASVESEPWDVVIGADLTYNRDAWPALFETIKRIGAPTLLSASERSPDELSQLRGFLERAGLRYRMLHSPFTRGYASTNIKLFWIEA